MKHMASIILLCILSAAFAPFSPAVGQEAAVGDDFRSRIEEKIREYTQRLDQLTDGAAGKTADRARELLETAEQKLREYKPQAEAALKEIESELRVLMEKIEKEVGSLRKENKEKKGEWI